MGKKTYKKVCHLTSVHQSHDVRIFYKECQSLSNAGYEVHLIVTHEKDERIDNINIHALPKPKNRIHRMLLLPFLALIKALKIKASIYHFHDPELIPVGIILRLFKKKVIYDVHEDVANHIMDKYWLKYYFLKKIISLLAGLLEKIGSLFFSKIIAVTPVIQEKFNNRKTVLLKNFPLLTLIDTITPYKKIISKYNIIYAGGLSNLRGIKEIIQSMKYLEHEAELWLFGKWESKEFLTECINLSSWNNIKYFGMLKPSELYSYLKVSDIGLSILYPVECYINSMPVKIFEYMACSLPMIISDFPIWRELFSNCALFVNPMDPLDIAEKINLLLNNKKLRIKLSVEGRNLIEQGYSWEAETKKLLEIYNNLL